MAEEEDSVFVFYCCRAPRHDAYSFGTHRGRRGLPEGADERRYLKYFTFGTRYRLFEKPVLSYAVVVQRCCLADMDTARVITKHHLFMFEI